MQIFFNKAKKMIKDLGLDYKKIDACPNDCILFWKEYKNIESCPKCGTSRWQINENANIGPEEIETPVKTKKIPTKILRYFSLILRIQRLFMSSKTSSSMRWLKKTV